MGHTALRWSQVGGTFIVSSYRESSSLAQDVASDCTQLQPITKRRSCESIKHLKTTTLELEGVDFFNHSATPTASSDWDEVSLLLFQSGSVLRAPGMQ